MSLVAIVGRPNVGKSTLFNRLVGMRQAIVDETAGVTRDRHYGKCDWCGTEFSVVDTGGWSSGSDDAFEEEIRKQVVIAIDEADVGRSTFYAHFETKDGLLREMCRSIFDHVLEEHQHREASHDFSLRSRTLPELLCLRSYFLSSVTLMPPPDACHEHIVR